MSSGTRAGVTVRGNASEEELAAVLVALARGAGAAGAPRPGTAPRPDDGYRVWRETRLRALRRPA